MTTGTRPQLPLAHDGLLDVEPDFARLRAEGPVARVRTPAGDPRLGQSHPDPAHAARISWAGVMSGPQDNVATEAADHARALPVIW